MKLVAPPKRAISHIQNTAPGPPPAMAVATPARFPVPTLDAVLIVNAWKEEMPRFPSAETVFLSVNSLPISLIYRNCTNLVRMEK